MFFVKVLQISVLSAAFIVIASVDPAVRLGNGQDIDNIIQFPFFVYIRPFASSSKCGGSIINSQWVLTSAGCVKDSIRLDLTFGMKNENAYDSEYFTISVNSDQVFAYPTNYDDVALVRLPMRLVFSDTISPVSISRLSIEALRNKFAVMPGFEERPLQTTTANPANYDNLKYGMFNVVEQSVCRQRLEAGTFDEHNQLCTEGWGTNTPCDNDYGSGLVVGWPAKSELIGLFSVYSSACDNSRPFAFTYVTKYLPWIESVTSGGY